MREINGKIGEQKLFEKKKKEPLEKNFQGGILYSVVRRRDLLVKLRREIKKIEEEEM